MFSRSKKIKLNNKGFSLIELLVVVAIIAILTVIVVARLDDAKQSGRDIKRISDARELAKALESYYQDFGTYPPCENGGEWCGSCDASGQESFAGALQPLVDDGEIPSIPVDPFNADCFTYAYITPPTVISEGMCGEKPIDNVGYVMRFTLENKVLPWDTYNENVATGTTYCIMGQDVTS